MRLPLAPDSRDAPARATALDRARDDPRARALLEAVLAAGREALDRARAGDHPGTFRALDRAYENVDRYLTHLAEAAELRVSCAAGCSACCTDAPPTMAVEGLRVLQALRQRSGSGPRIQRAVEYARRFQTLLRERTQSTGQVNIASEAYRRTQIDWRALGLPCPALDDDGRCSIYEARPLACRVHVHVQDPARCEASHPEFLNNERPPVWVHPREAEFERILLAISTTLGLPPTPNLPWAMAALHEHPAAKAPEG